MGSNSIYKSLSNFYNWLRNCSDLKKAIVISIITGILISVVLILESKEESFSSLYIYPESYTNYPEGNTTSFIYGFESHEKEITPYHLEIFIGNVLIEKEDFELNPLEVHEEMKVLNIPAVKFPSKVTLVVKSPHYAYDSYYWLRRANEEKPTPLKTKPALTPTPALTPNPGSTSLPQSTTTPKSPSPSPQPITTPISTPPSVPGNFTAIMIDRGFAPKTVNISVGRTIMWVNRDTFDRKMTLVSSKGVFTTVINIDSRFFYTFNTSGVYTFSLQEVPGVEGKVIVN